MSTTVPVSASENLSTYDQIPYPSAAFAQTHPSRIAAVARLFGVSVPDFPKVRVLELGCADGSNLIPMAEQMPSAVFLGIDFSGVQIKIGQQAVAAAGLQNIELRQQDILAFPADAGKFDFIIAHGVFSWVSESIREKILAICAEHLTESGIAYVSYNAHPGWNMRRSLRDMMLYHTRTFSDPKEKVQQARALLAFLTESVPAENNAYGMLLKSELAFMSDLSDNYLLHDILFAENTPFYFHEFIGRANKHGLQYLAETNVAEMLTANFTEKVQQTLAQLNSQIVAQEQYMDFIRNRSFRQNLLCRTSVPIQRAIHPKTMTQLAFRSFLVNAASPVELMLGVPVSFATVGGAQVTSDDPFVKAMLSILTETKGVAVIGYASLLTAARMRARPFLGELPPNRDEIDEATLQTNLLNLLVKGFIEIYAEPVEVRTDIPEKPVVGAYVRYQALNARLVTNRAHRSVPADMVARYVIAACDGTRTKDELLSELVARVREGKLQVTEGGAAITDEAKLGTIFRTRLETALVGLANAGFFAP